MYNYRVLEFYHNYFSEILVDGHVQEEYDDVAGPGADKVQYYQDIYIWAQYFKTNDVVSKQDLKFSYLLYAKTLLFFLLKNVRSFSVQKLLTIFSAIKKKLPNYF